MFFETDDVNMTPEAEARGTRSNTMKTRSGNDNGKYYITYNFIYILDKVQYKLRIK